MVGIEKIKDVLAERGLKKKWLAEKVGITPGYLSQILSGSRPGWVVRLRITAELGLSYDDLWGGWE